MTSATSASTPFRVVRAAVFATVSVVLSVGAHAWAGGSTTAPAVLVALTLSFLAGVALAGRERSARVIFPALAGCQAVLHLMFSYAHSVEPMMAGHHHATTLLPSLSMLLTHAWAAGLTALWLARGEAVLWALLRRLEVRLLLLLRMAVEPAHPQVAVPADRVVIPASALLRHEISRRGPPGIVSLLAA
ncbi:MFS transporter [Herbidospora galbida]|uniref:MFS transporter n=1 Tax=Herbidospora galbida TaxID=2575442 RepID=A0A4U3MC31_9ACTN|nr:MFS transporter [Herbidospora galbida]TKK85176.1 MFS transporter [Herbidospora galbida]